MRIDLVCSDPSHPLIPVLEKWCAGRIEEHETRIVHRIDDLRGGDLLLLVACQDIIGPKLRGRYRHTLVTHASDLPNGRGWSPAAWTVLEGGDRLVVSLLEAADKVDSGKIWQKFSAQLAGTEVFEELQDILARLILEAVAFAAGNAETVEPVPQDAGGSWYRKRTPEDSRLDPHGTIADQFDLLRVCDPLRYPAFFEYRGREYTVQIAPRRKG